jgi:hypothetical protein
MIDVFADDTVVEQIAAFGFVGYTRELLDDVSNAVQEVKGQFGIDLSATLHCRELFFQTRRERGQFRNLASKDVYALYLSLAERLSGRLRPLTSIGFVNLRTMPNGIDFTARTKGQAKQRIVMHSKSQEQKGKQAAAFGFWAGTAPFRNHLKQPLDQCTFAIAQDSTRIEWINGRRQAHYAAAWLGRDLKVQVLNASPLLEIADLVAYAGGHTVAKSARADSLRNILQKLAPRFWEFTFEPKWWHLPALNDPTERRFLGSASDVTDSLMV